MTPPKKGCFGEVGRHTRHLYKNFLKCAISPYEQSKLIYASHKPDLLTTLQLLTSREKVVIAVESLISIVFFLVEIALAYLNL